MRAWSSEDADDKITDEKKLARLVQSREFVTIMDLQDYDHDGRATEFLLPVGGVGCAFHGYVALGISRGRPELHVIGSAMHPDKPVVLTHTGWQVLRAQSKGTYVQYECGFRGGETQVEVELKTDPSGIHAVEIEYSCPRKRGHVVSRVEK